MRRTGVVIVLHLPRDRPRNTSPSPVSSRQTKAKTAPVRGLLSSSPETARFRVASRERSPRHFEFVVRHLDSYAIEMHLSV